MTLFSFFFFNPQRLFRAEKVTQWSFHLCLVRINNNIYATIPAPSFKQTNPNWRKIENENREIIRKGIFSIGSVWRCLFEIVIHPPPIPFEFYSQDFHFPLFNWIEIDSWFSQDENYENIVYNSYYQVLTKKLFLLFFLRKYRMTS